MAQLNPTLQSVFGKFLGFSRDDTELNESAWEMYLTAAGINKRARMNLEMFKQTAREEDTSDLVELVGLSKQVVDSEMRMAEAARLVVEKSNKFSSVFLDIMINSGKIPVEHKHYFALALH